MNIDVKKTCWRYVVGILFWSFIVCLGFFLVPSGGGTGFGKGTGSGSGNEYGTGTGGSGTGTGQGQTDAGSGSGDSGTGTDDKATVEAPKTETPPAPAPGSAPDGKVVRTKPPAEAKPAPLKIMPRTADSPRVATIYVPTKSSGGGSNPGKETGTASGFFGMRISGPVIFLLDISGSMCSTNREGTMTRLDMVKSEFCKTLVEKFEEVRKNETDEHFRLACFSNDCTLFPEEKKSGYSFSSRTNIEKASAFANALQANGSTNMMHAWNTILPIIAREEIRAVYFLSDGDPSDCSPDQLLHQLKKLVPKLQINTISMGQPSPLLKEIAKQHQGKYREVL